MISGPDATAGAAVRHGAVQRQAGDHLFGDQEHPGHAQVAGPADGLASGNGGVQARML